MFKELWKSCAGPLVDMPKEGERVYYFPQGHIEQVEASMNETSTQEIPHFELNSKILCHVVNTHLLAERDTDEVYAQVTLLPTMDQRELTSRDPCLPEPARPGMHSFAKVLTASDTSTHGGFSVLRKHAQECLPALIMNQEAPSQDIEAFDLHGTLWRFKHIFRGQPKRHLLTTGWSNFVTQKKLVTGDTLVFLRNENGHSRIGVRRQVRQHSSAPSSVISSQSMHLGVLATASQAVFSQSRFTIFYKPRTVQFIVGVNKYLEGVNNGFSVGMRFQMRFEGDDLPERRFTGTIVEVGDLSPQWVNSRWRSLQVAWDEPASILRPERVSPWEIEPFVAPVPASLGQAVVLKHKRSRPSKGNHNAEAGSSGLSARLKSTNEGQRDDNPNTSRNRNHNHGSWLSSSSPLVIASRNVHEVDETEERRSAFSPWSGKQRKDSIPSSASGSTCRIFGIDINIPPKGGDKEAENIQSNATRTRTKVMMQGMVVGRAVDLTLLRNYKELIEEMEKMFGIEGELHTQEEWEIVYTDGEGDDKLMGDQPWREFCSTVKRITIRSSQQVKKMRVGSKFPSSTDGEASGSLEASRK
ncbi:auxin response factor 11-like [Bidens hawaiensis]|uniref:auxin response factor 11-like n=1 Tax=Bidens hawaiensis TaxID=980011 RepID=UPI0040493459